MELNPTTILTSILALIGTTFVGWLAHWGTARARQVDDATAIRKELWHEIANLKADLRATDDDLEDCRRQHWQAERWVWILAEELRGLGRTFDLPDLTLKDTPPVRPPRRRDLDEASTGGTHPPPGAGPGMPPPMGGPPSH